MSALDNINGSLTRARKKAPVPFFVVVFLTIAAVPVLAAILVQNFTQFDVVVDNPPINIVQGADANYDGDANDSTGVIQVSLAPTITNSDSTLGTPGVTDTLLSRPTITFTCFEGSRAFYSDVLQLVNTDAVDWDVTLLVEADIVGNPAVSDTFSAGDADIWLFSSEVDSSTAVTQIPNPNSYGSLTQWYDSASPNGAIQLEVVSGTMSAASAITGPFTVPTTEQRQIGLVVDCGSNMVNSETGTFRVTVSSSPT